MTSLMRIGLSRILQNGGQNPIANKIILQVGIRNITSKSMRIGPRPKKPAPWNYRDRRYTLFHYIYDKTTPRFDENTKLIVVEGPVAAGKTKFAKELAAELDMMYFPEANLDMYYINSYGYDLKQLDPQLPEACRSFDVKDFLLNPKHRSTATFQFSQYSVKYSQYIDALAHILSTGQGVVLDRCIYSDFVFVEAMFSQGYLSKGARSAYYEVRKNSIGELLRPHLIIYLDVPIPKTLENIKKRNLACEASSSVLTAEYLAVMEKYYKQQYLKELSGHTELLIYDFSDQGETEVIVEDIERIGFDRADEQDPKLKDWVNYTEEEWSVLRYKYADNKNFLLTYLNVPTFQVPELVVEAEDMENYKEILNQAPGEQYEKGYNRAMGDSSNLFKVKYPHRENLPLIERKLT